MSGLASAWPDEVDEILVGDLTAAFACTTPAGGVVLTPVAPIGLRDRARGTVGFTTSLGFGRKLERIAADPQVALAYHARDHGGSRRPGLVVAQGRAVVVAGSDVLREELAEQAARYLGPIKHGPFWDRWLAVYYADRVLVEIVVERILWWRDTLGAGEPRVLGSPLPAPPDAQAPPPKGTAARVDVVKAAKRLQPLHRLLAWRDRDGYPSVVAAGTIVAAPDDLRLGVAASIVPPGGRRAALLAHDYQPRLVGLRMRYSLGWLEVNEAGCALAPQKLGGFTAPPNKTLLLLANGYLARRNLKRAGARPTA